MSDDNQIPSALDRISDWIVAVDEEFRYTYVNDRAEELLDAQRDALLGTPLWDSVPNISETAARATIEDSFATGETRSIDWYVDEWEQWWNVRVFPDSTGVTLLLAEITEQKRRENNLGRLHQATRKMLAASSPVEVAEVVSQTAVDLLDLPLNGVHFYDESTDALEAVAVSPGTREILGDAPSLDTGLAWESYKTGEIRVSQDLREEDNLYDEGTPFRSELIIPLDEFGVFIVAATRVNAFSDMDLTFAKLLGANATEALSRVDNENRLEKQRDNLELLTEMMSHDIRNDLQVIAAAADGLAERVNGEESVLVEKINQSTAEAVELTTSARDLAQAMLRTDADRKPISLDRPLRGELEDIEATSDVSITLPDPIPSVSVLAGDMLDSVFRNILKNAVEHNDTESPEVTITVETDSETVRVRVADNGPGIPDARKEDIFGRGEKGMSSKGTGIGLYLVRTLTEQYGGSVWVEDNEPTGAVFVVELTRADTASS